MTSKDIKDIKIMTDGGMVTPKKLILQSSLIFPLPQIQGVTIKGLFDLRPSNEWKKGILMSSDGIVRELSNSFIGHYTPLSNIKSKDDILIIDYLYAVGDGTIAWKWGDGQKNNWDIWPDRFYDGHFKVETSDEYNGMATYLYNSGVQIENAVNIFENLSTDQGNKHVVGLYEIIEN